MENNKYNFDDFKNKNINEMSKTDRDKLLIDIIARLKPLADDAKKDIEIGDFLLINMYRDEDEILERYTEGKIKKEIMEKEFKLLKENNVTVADMRKKLEEGTELRKKDLTEIEQTIKMAKIILNMDNTIDGMPEREL